MSVPIEKLLSVAFLVPMGEPSDADCRWGLNVMLWGEPGIGKSDRIEMAAAMVNLPPRTVYAATTQPEDISGAAFVNSSKGIAMLEGLLEGLHETFRQDVTHDHNNLVDRFAHMLKPYAMAGIERALQIAKKYGPATTSIEPLLPGISDLMIDQQGVLFLDELSCARPAVQGAYLGVTLARRVGGKKLPARVRIVAAANPPGSAAGGWELEPPMANRFCHINVPVPSKDEWVQWLINETTTRLDGIEDGEARVRRRWPDEWPVVKGLVAGYMNTQAQDALHKIPKEGDPNRGLAWPSPRTWVFNARTMATCRCLDIEDTVRDALMEGCIGAAEATSFAAWIADADLPTPQDMLKDGWEPDQKRLDRTVAAYTALTSYVLGRPTDQERADIAPAAWNCLQQATDGKMLDIILPMAQSFVANGLDSKKSKAIADAAKPVLVRLAKAGMSQFLTNIP